MKTVPYIEECLKIGRVSRTNGGDGALLINFTGSQSVDWKQVKFIFLNIQNKPVPFKILSYKLKKRSCIFMLQTVVSDSIAERYIGFDVYVAKQDASEEVQNQAPEIIGYSVMVENKLLGEITDIIEYPMHQLFEITKPNGEEVLVPFSEDFIISLEFDKKQLHLQLPEGLLDLYS